MLEMARLVGGPGNSVEEDGEKGVILFPNLEIVTAVENSSMEMFCLIEADYF